MWTDQDNVSEWSNNVYMWTDQDNVSEWSNNDYMWTDQIIAPL
jgi:hypothetical protein